MGKPFRKAGFERREAFRKKLFAKQKGLCHLCGKQMTLQRGASINVGRLFATFDHLVPTSLGGTGLTSNIKLAHKTCNNDRRDMPISRVEAGHPAFASDRGDDK